MVCQEQKRKTHESTYKPGKRNKERDEDPLSSQAQESPWVPSRNALLSSGTILGTSKKGLEKKEPTHHTQTHPGNYWVNCVKFWIAKKLNDVCSSFFLLYIFWTHTLASNNTITIRKGIKQILTTGGKTGSCLMKSKGNSFWARSDLLFCTSRK